MIFSSGSHVVMGCQGSPGSLVPVEVTNSVSEIHYWRPGRRGGSGGRGGGEAAAAAPAVGTRGGRAGGWEGGGGRWPVAPDFCPFFFLRICDSLY